MVAVVVAVAAVVVVSSGACSGVCSAGHGCVTSVSCSGRSGSSGVVVEVAVAGTNGGRNGKSGDRWKQRKK